VAEDRKLGERALLRQSYFPSEYEGGIRHGEEPTSVNHLLHFAATQCLHVDGPVVAHKNPATVWSGEFGDNREEGAPSGYPHIENTVTVEPTEAAARLWLSIFARARAPWCIGEADRIASLQASPGQRKLSNSVGAARISRLGVPRYGDQSVAYRLTIPILVEGHHLSEYLDYIIVRNGRAHMMLTFEKLDDPVSTTMERHLTSETTRRLRG
jgi:hypothetical protein